MTNMKADWNSEGDTSSLVQSGPMWRSTKQLAKGIFGLWEVCVSLTQQFSLLQQSLLLGNKKKLKCGAFGDHGSGSCIVFNVAISVNTGTTFNWCLHIDEACLEIHEHKREEEQERHIQIILSKIEPNQPKVAQDV
jgi:hypothetical protein